jgi:hypothetical protein
MRVGEWRRRTDYWNRHPPVCELLEILVGWKVPPPETRERLSDSDVRELGALAEGD